MVAVVLDAVRTPYAESGGALKGWHPVSLLAATLDEVCRRVEIDTQAVERVLVGCATPIGEQALNVARNAVLAAGWPESVVASSIDGHASAGMYALVDAVGLVNSAIAPIVLAGGVESATRVPDGAASGAAVGKPFGPQVHERYADVDGLASPGRIAEALAQTCAVTRAELDEYALLTRNRFQNAQKTDRFKSQLVPLAFKNAKGVDTATQVTHDTFRNVADTSTLLSLFETDGLLTSATFAHPADGASAALITTDTTAAANRWPVLCEITDSLLVGNSPLGGDSGAAALGAVLQRNNLTVRDLDRVDVHEDTAVTPLALSRALALHADQLNPLGGALSIGAPLGSVGVGLLAGCAHGLTDNDQNWGAVVVAGTANSTAVMLLRRV